MFNITWQFLEEGSHCLFIRATEKSAPCWRCLQANALWSVRVEESRCQNPRSTQWSYGLPQHLVPTVASVSPRIRKLPFGWERVYPSPPVLIMIRCSGMDVFWSILGRENTIGSFPSLTNTDLTSQRNYYPGREYRQWVFKQYFCLSSFDPSFTNLLHIDQQNTVPLE